MPLELSKEQYRKLVKMVYIAEWVINSYRTEEEEYEFTDIEQYIYSYAASYGCDDILEYDEESGMYFPSSEMDDELMVYIDDFLNSNQGDFIGFN